MLWFEPLNLVEHNGVGTWVGRDGPDLLHFLDLENQLAFKMDRQTMVL